MPDNAPIPKSLTSPPPSDGDKHGSNGFFVHVDGLMPELKQLRGRLGGRDAELVQSIIDAHDNAGASD